MNVKKADFGGCGMEHTCRSTDLNALVLEEYRLDEENVPLVDDLDDDDIYKHMPALESLCYSSVAVRSKISRVEKDFSITDIVPFEEGELIVCGRRNNSIVYYKQGFDDCIFLSTSSGNKYVAACDAAGKCYRDVFVVAEDVDEDNEKRKITVFDYDLNVLDKYTEKRGYIDTRIPTGMLDFYETNDNKELYARYDEFDNYRKRLKKRYNDLYINDMGIDNKFFLKNVLYSDFFTAACEDRKTKQHYMIKFTRSGEIEWKIEAPDMFTDNILRFGDNYYCLNYTDKSYHRCRLSKYSNAGVLLDSYDFKGVDSVFTVHNDMPVIVFNDLANYNDWQRKLRREAKAYIGPAAMLVISDD